MEGRLLRVLTAVAGTPDAAERALRRLLRTAGRGESVLLFCDLPPAPSARELDDAATVRRLQSGVMAMDARRPGELLLLVRRRAWDDAARAYLGDGQRQSPMEAVASLLVTGACDAAFEAASVSPASLKGRFDAALFSPLSLACTPGTPARMLLAAGQRGVSCACARVLPPAGEYESALDRLRRLGFSLSPADAAIDARLAAQGACRAPREATLLTLPALRALAEGRPLPSAALVEECYFAQEEASGVYALLERARTRANRAFARLRERDGVATRLSCAAALLPAVQTALLLLAGLLGSAPLAAAAVVLPEYPALLNPRLLPGALTRVALLPAHAACAVQALLDHATARSRLIRLRVTDGARGASGCVVAGSALLFAALYGAGALVPLLPVSLLWFAAPLLFPALSAPTRERVPLKAQERARLFALARDALPGTAESPSGPRRMLAACAGCMLGLLEPDEAARQAQACLPDEGAALLDEEFAALLASAQALRERMADCDAALRGLPAQIEARALTCAFPGEGALGLLLRAAADAARGLEPRDALPDARALCAHPAAAPGDALFLPVPLWRNLPAAGPSLPLTHPHTFLRAPGLESRQASPDGAQRFLFLAAAALRHPFPALLLRSPVAAPYAPLWAWLVHGAK